MCGSQAPVGCRPADAGSCDRVGDIPSDSPSASRRFGRDESVKQCLEIMSEVSAEQRARARHLDTKTGTLAGFAATVLTLNATLGRPLLDANLPKDAASRVEVYFTVSVIALGLAALVAVVGVLRPMGHKDLDEEQIDAYSDHEKVNADPEDLRMTWLRTVTEMAISDRTAGTRKARLGNLAVLCLAIGLCGVAAQALTLVANQ